jgi:hypothetical protein
VGCALLGDARPLFVSCFKSTTLLLFSIHTSVGWSRQDRASPWVGFVPKVELHNDSSESRALDDSKYQWKQSQDDPALWQREALAVKKLWPLRPKPKEVRELYLGLKLLLFEPIGAAGISSATQEAWKEMRILHPEIALTARVLSDGQRLLEFHVLCTKRS